MRSAKSGMGPPRQSLTEAVFPFNSQRMRPVRHVLRPGSRAEKIRFRFLVQVRRTGKPQFGRGHTCSLAAPSLLEEAKAAGVRSTPKEAGATQNCDKMRAAGQWNTAWDPFFELDPAWTDAFFAAGAPVYIGNVLSPKLAELLSIAGDASITHM